VAVGTGDGEAVTVGLGTGVKVNGTGVGVDVDGRDVGTEGVSTGVAPQPAKRAMSNAPIISVQREA
jgi:hypothetical protein